MNAEGWKIAEARVQHRRSRGGRLLRIVEERYLRLDIPCPFEKCQQCRDYRQSQQAGDAEPPKLFDASTVDCFIPDASALIRQLDVLRSPLMKKPILLLQSVLEQVSKLARPQYYRVLRELKACPIFPDQFHKHTSHGTNEAMLWFSTHLPNVKFHALSHAPVEIKGVPSITVESVVESMGNVALSELLAIDAHDDGMKMGEVSSRPQNDDPYEKHWEGERLETALRDGLVTRSTIRVWAAGRFGACLIGGGLECRLDGVANVNRAIDGDQVAVLLEDNRPARVVAVIKRNWRLMAGSLMESDEDVDLNRTSVWFIPISTAIPRVKIHTRNVERLVGQLFVVRLDSWEETQRFPSGHVVQVLGSIGDQKVESAALLIEYNIRDEPFTEAVMEQCPPIDWKVEAEHCVGREDMRAVRIFSIDPPGCTDIDDALHVTRLPDGTFEVGVHIADVSHFIKEDDPIDREAQGRGSSVYLVDRRIDMIPGRLSTQICSLREKVDRLAFSCIWLLDAKANIISTRFARTVIRSQRAMAYSDAQVHIDDKTAAEFDDQIGSGDMGRDCRDLNKLAMELRARRMEAGALTLASPEIKFKLDKVASTASDNCMVGGDPSCGNEAQPMDIMLYEIKQANSLVEEFMLLANISVAQQIVTSFPSRALLRRHPPPAESSLQRLIDAAKTCGAELDVGSSKALADSLDRAVASKRNDPIFDNALRIYATRCMNQAVYFCSGSVPPGQYLHYGLAAPLYTHFTSPIRRYADLVVHRLLATSLSIDTMPAVCKHKTTLSQMTTSINRLSRAAQGAGRASVQLFTLVYFDGRVVDADAIVMEIRVDGLTVFVKEFGIEAKIDLLRDTRESNRGVDEESDRLTDQELSASAGFVFDESAQTLITPAFGSFSMFQPVRVRIQVEHRKHGRRNLVLQLIDASTPASSDAPTKATPATKRRRVDK